uniref:Uncharacterized protein n=1 Tax=Oryza meridionalis TaxID=40149 RepID=A0A0E0C967_9ORYZ
MNEDASARAPCRVWSARASATGSLSRRRARYFSFSQETRPQRPVDVRTRGSAVSSCQLVGDKIKGAEPGKAERQQRAQLGNTMAPAALAAPIASISPSSAGRVTAAVAGLRSARMASSPVAQSVGEAVVLRPNQMFRSVLRQRRRLVVRSSSSDETNSTTEEKTPFGYTRKDVLLIGVGVTLLGYGLKYGLEVTSVLSPFSITTPLVGVDPLQAGNAVQLIIVLGMTVGWISTYMFRVANKDMTYAQQLRDYEKQVMEKRLESLTEAELQVLLEQVEEEKQRLTPVRDQGVTFTRKTEDQANAS